MKLVLVLLILGKINSGNQKEKIHKYEWSNGIEKKTKKGVIKVDQ